MSKKSRAIVITLVVVIIGLGGLLIKSSKDLSSWRCEAEVLLEEKTHLQQIEVELTQDIYALEESLLAQEEELRLLEDTRMALEEEVVGLEGAIASLQKEGLELREDLEYSRERAKTFQYEAEILSTKLTRVSYPRHFESLGELRQWLKGDKTDIESRGVDWLEWCFILQVKAAQDGYLLPVALYEGSRGEFFVANKAVIGDELYIVYVDTEEVFLEFYIYGCALYPILPP